MHEEIWNIKKKMKSPTDMLKHGLDFLSWGMLEYRLSMYDKKESDIYSLIRFAYSVGSHRSFQLLVVKYVRQQNLPRWQRTVAWRTRWRERRYWQRWWTSILASSALLLWRTTLPCLGWRLLSPVNRQKCNAWWRNQRQSEI